MSKPYIQEVLQSIIMFYTSYTSNLKLRLELYNKVQRKMLLIMENIFQESTQVLFDRMNHYTDHLGNIRLSYGRDPETGKVTILKESHYYPFGLEHQGYVGTHKTIGIGIGKVRLVPV